MSYRVDGSAAHALAMDNAFREGVAAKLAGEAQTANPYATTMEWGGQVICPMEQQRDQWDAGWVS